MTNRSNPGTPPVPVFHPYHMAVFIGRFAPLHIGHLSVIDRALEISDTLVILVGSVDKPRDYFNPFTFDERRSMIEGSIVERYGVDILKRVLVLPITDVEYNDPQWVVGVQVAAMAARDHFTLDAFAKIALIGHNKDGTSYYLNKFPQWGSVNVGGYFSEAFVLSATMIRENLFLRGDLPDVTTPFQEGMVTNFVRDWLATFKESEAYAYIRDEYLFVEDGKEPYKHLKYPPIFVTVDACVIKSGHVLLVKRRSRPGKGTWALPGGFLNASERIEDAVMRELIEETKIDQRESFLRRSVVANKVFDGVHRSARGRTITHAFLIDLGEGDLPKVKGSDDAKKAKWVPISDLRRDMMFEDHFAIISYFLGQTKS